MFFILGKCFQQIEYIQMAQNSFKKEIGLVEAQIDCSMQRISQLLQLLAKQQKPSLLVAKQSQQDGNEWLNQTQHETDYNTTGTDMLYHFISLHYQDEEILLDGYSNCDHKYAQEIKVSLPKQMTVATKSNWIDSFLYCDDTKVMLDHQTGVIQLLHVQKGHFNCANSYKEQLTIESSQIYSHKSLLVQFPTHLKGYQLNLKVQSQKMLYQFTIQYKSRILFECPNEGLDLIWFLIVKEEDENYQILWGAYSQEAILQSLILQSGTYIIFPLSGSAQLCNIYYQETTSIVIKKETQQPFKSFNLLKRLFEQCRQTLGLKRSYSLVSDTPDTKKQYLRSCYMNYGIIVEIYYNIFEQECKFIDQCHQREDKQLLFQEIYTPSQIGNILCPGQQLIKFYIINKKPANLFIPHKKVFVGNKAMQNLAYHHVFK